MQKSRTTIIARRAKTKESRRMGLGVSGKKIFFGGREPASLVSVMRGEWGILEKVEVAFDLEDVYWRRKGDAEVVEHLG